MRNRANSIYVTFFIAITRDLFELIVFFSSLRAARKNGCSADGKRFLGKSIIM